MQIVFSSNYLCSKIQPQRAAYIALDWGGLAIRSTVSFNSGATTLTGTMQQDTRKHNREKECAVLWWRIGPIHLSPLHLSPSPSAIWQEVSFNHYRDRKRQYIDWGVVLHIWNSVQCQYKKYALWIQGHINKPKKKRRKIWDVYFALWSISDKEKNTRANCFAKMKRPLWKKKVLAYTFQLTVFFRAY